MLKFQSNSSSFRNNSHHSSAMSPWCQYPNKWTNRSNNILQALLALSNQLVVVNKASQCSKLRHSSKVSYSSSWLSSRHHRLNKWHNHHNKSHNRKGTSSCKSYSTVSTASSSSMPSARSSNSSNSCWEGSAMPCHRAHSMLLPISHLQVNSSITGTTPVLHKSIFLNSHSRLMSSSNKQAQRSKGIDKTNKTGSNSFRLSIKSNSNWVSSSVDPNHRKPRRIEPISLLNLSRNNVSSNINSFPEHPKTAKANRSRTCTETSNKQNQTTSWMASWQPRKSEGTSQSSLSQKIEKNDWNTNLIVQINKFFKLL